jgi:hypothetical protein
VKAHAVRCRSSGDAGPHYKTSASTVENEHGLFYNVEFATKAVKDRIKGGKEDRLAKV